MTTKPYFNTIDSLIVGRDPCSTCSVMTQRYVGFKEDNCDYQKYFSQDTVNTISAQLTNLLSGVGKDNRPIVVPDEHICSIMDNVYQSYRPRTSDIYSRYNINNGSNTPSYVQELVDQVIEIIYSNVRDSLGIEEANAKLSAWTTVLGDFNDHGLRAHPVIKIKQRRPNPLQFMWNY